MGPCSLGAREHTPTTLSESSRQARLQKPKLIHHEQNHTHSRRRSPPGHSAFLYKLPSREPRLPYRCRMGAAPAKRRGNCRSGCSRRGTPCRSRSPAAILADTRDATNATGVPDCSASLDSHEKGFQGRGGRTRDDHPLPPARTKRDFCSTRCALQVGALVTHHEVALQGAGPFLIHVQSALVDNTTVARYGCHLVDPGRLRRLREKQECATRLCPWTTRPPPLAQLRNDRFPRIPQYSDSIWSSDCSSYLTSLDQETVSERKQGPAEIDTLVEVVHKLLVNRPLESALEGVEQDPT